MSLSYEQPLKNTVARLAPNLCVFRFRSFLFREAMEDQANARLFSSHLTMLCRFSFVDVSFGMCYIYAACARKVQTRVHFSLRNHIATFTTNIIIIVDKMCAELVCIRVRACSLVAILCLSGTVVRRKGISCTAYCAITTNHTATSKADSDSWLQKAPLPLILWTPPLTPSDSAESSRQAQCMYERYAT